MKTRAKGNRIRRKVIQLLEDNNYKVAIVERTGRFIKDKDMFGLFDIVAITSNFPPAFIQITCNTPHNHKKLSDFAKEFKSVTVSQYVWKDNKGFVFYEYNPKGKPQYTKVNLW